MSLPNQTSIIYRVSQDSLLNYVEPSTVQAAVTLSNIVQVPLSTNNYAINLATLFPALTSLVALTLLELTQPALGFAVMTASGAANPFLVRAGSIFSFGANYTSLPTLYINNTAASILQLQILATGS